jgi:hypothetical protein
VSEQRGIRASSDYHKAASRHGVPVRSLSVGRSAGRGALALLFWPMVRVPERPQRGAHGTRGGAALRAFGARVCARVRQPSEPR